MKTKPLQKQTKSAPPPAYIPGLSISDIQKKYRLKTVCKLSSNENPLPPPPGLLAALSHALPHINRYPSPPLAAVRACAHYYQADPSQIALGNGSSELLDKLFQIPPLMNRPPAPRGQPGVLVSELSFPLYDICAYTHGWPIYKAPMEGAKSISVPALLSCLKKHNNIRLVLISNPNNPTGSYLSHAQMERLLKWTAGRNVLIVLDEAYREFARAKNFPISQGLLKKYPHLVLVRSLSKVMGLAGLRAGVLLAHPSIAGAVKKVIYPFNMNSLALAAVQYCCLSPSFKKHIQKSKALVWEGVDYLSQQLSRMGFEVCPSNANFILFSPAGRGLKHPFGVKRPLGVKHSASRRLGQKALQQTLKTQR